VRAACAQAGIALDVAGGRSGNVLERPEEALGRYDLVFAKARAALEAMAVGCAVVLCDLKGAGPMVTTENLDRLRPLNFGMRTLRQAPTAQWLAREIARYDPADAAEVSRRIRASAGSDALVDDLVALYEDVISEHAASPPADAAAEGLAAAAYLGTLAPRLRERDLLRDVFLRLLRVPVVGALLRRRPALAPLLRMLDQE
jgi:hypothetical protein